MKLLFLLTENVAVHEQGRFWLYLQASEELKSLFPLPWPLGMAGTEHLNWCCSISLSLVGFEQVWCSKRQGNLFSEMQLHLICSPPGLVSGFKHWTLLPKHSKEKQLARDL